MEKKNNDGRIRLKKPYFVGASFYFRRTNKINRRKGLLFVLSKM
jgi:hypothetical protein